MKFKSMLLAFAMVLSMAFLAPQVHAGYENITDVEVYDPSTNCLIWSAPKDIDVQLNTDGDYQWQGIHINVDNSHLIRGHFYKVTYKNFWTGKLACGLFKVTETEGITGFWSSPPAPLPVVNK